MKNKILIVILIVIVFGVANVIAWESFIKHRLAIDVVLTPAGGQPLSDIHPIPISSEPALKLDNGWYTLEGKIKTHSSEVTPPYLILAISGEKFSSLLKEFGYSNNTDITKLNITFSSDDYFVRFVKTNSGSDAVGNYSIQLPEGEYYVCAAQGEMGPGPGRAVIKSCAKVSVPQDGKIIMDMSVG